jgi:hypothetical protein
MVRHFLWIAVLLQVAFPKPMAAWGPIGHMATRIACIHGFDIGLQSDENPAKGQILLAIQDHFPAEVLAVQPSHRESGQQ